MTTPQTGPVSGLVPNLEFARLARDAQIDWTAKALEARNFKAIVAGNGAEAKGIVLGLLPAGAEVFSGESETLEAIGLLTDREGPG